MMMMMMMMILMMMMMMILMMMITGRIMILMVDYSKNGFSYTLLCC